MPESLFQQSRRPKALLKSDSVAQMVKFSKFLRTPFLQTLWVTASGKLPITAHRWLLLMDYIFTHIEGVSKYKKRWF